MDRESISFGRFRLDVGRRELLSDGEPVQLHGRALDILCALAAAKGEVVGKDELLNRLWPGRIVEEGNIHVHVSALRRALDNQGEGHSYVVTVPGRGYRLAGLTGASSAGPAASPSPQPLPQPDKPSIAVLPFTNLSGDPEQEYFCDGMVEEITTLLSRIRWLLVIARNSSFTYKGQAVDVPRIGRVLGVRYVLEGSVRRAGNQLRISAQLIEAEAGAHLWADRFDGSLENVFELQDQIAISVAARIEPKLRAVETRRSSKRPTSDLTAYDLYLRALPLGRSMAKDQLMVSIELLRRAIEQDPEYGPALASLAHSYYRMDIQGWAQEGEHNRRTAIDLIRRALRAASDDPEVLATAAMVLGYFGEDIYTSVELIDQALTLNPSSVRGWQTSGVIRNWIGRSDIALEHLQNASRLDPINYSTRNLTVLGIALFFNRRFDEAASKLIEALEEQPNVTLNYRFLAASYAHMERLDEARAIIARLRTITSDVLDSGARFRNPEYRDLYLSGLRLASGA